jgi:jumonji domain-containing protein 7
VISNVGGTEEMPEVPKLTIVEDGIEVNDIWQSSANSNMGTDGFNWTQVSLSRENNFPKTDLRIHEFAAEDFNNPDEEPRLFHKIYSRSVPGVVRGYAKELSGHLGTWTLDHVEKEWGQQRAVAAYSPHNSFQRPVDGTLVSPHQQMEQMSEIIQSLRIQAELYKEGKEQDEYVAVQQSPARDLSQFGIDILPPLFTMVRPVLQAQNLWLCTHGKKSTLHNDYRDNILVQLVGSKNITLIDPSSIGGVYPAKMRVRRLIRESHGKFSLDANLGPEVENFPLVSLEDPDYERHPKFRDVPKFQVTLHAGDALFLPAYWFHEVDSAAGKNGINIAVNYWFQTHSMYTRFWRTFRENVFEDCSKENNRC